MLSPLQVLALAHTASVRVRHYVEFPASRASVRRVHALRSAPLLDGALDGAVPAAAPQPPPEPVRCGGELHGLFLAYKPQNWSSFQVVNCIKHTLNRQHAIPREPGQRKRSHKVGHGGTLDPLATGVLVIGVGRGCRELGGFLSGSKAYRARLTFGTETDTQDSTGTVIRSADASHVTLDALRAALPALTGRILQRPPVFSAISINGRRSYSLARAGELTEEDMEPRAVHVHDLRAASLEERAGADGLRRLEADLLVECGGGTYIRSLIVDLARALGTAAHMSGLERVKQGPFSLQSCRVLHEDDFREAPAIVDALGSASAFLGSLPPPPPPEPGPEPEPEPAAELAGAAPSASDEEEPSDVLRADVLGA